MQPPIQRAIAFVRSKVIDPALADAGLDDGIKYRVRNSRVWLDHFDKVGDLLQYLQRFRGTVSPDTFQALRSRNLLTFEDIIDEFELKFGLWASDRTSPSTFVIGEQYDSYQILIFVGAYDTRAGGMFLLGPSEAPDAVVVKATLQGGRYPNGWIEPHVRLRYYLKSRNGVFGEHFQENAAIRGHPSVPVMTFVREMDEMPFTYEGVFSYVDIHRDGDGSKWFELARRESESPIDNVVQQTYDSALLAAQVEAAKGLPPEELSRRLAGVPRKPKKLIVQTTAFERSPLVIAAVLQRANGQCEQCRDPAPFSRRSDGSPYLEVHHKVRLVDDGEDTVENAIAICPNCHREAHYG